MKQLFTFHGNDEILRALLMHEVTYLVVGGLAVKFYCEERIADDMDLLLDSSLENARRVSCALSSIQTNSSLLTPEALNHASLRIPLKISHHSDLLTLSPNVQFSSLWQRRVAGKLNSFSVNFISKLDLIAMKNDASNTCEEKQKHQADIKLLSSSTP